jgi:hypothetical protein
VQECEDETFLAGLFEQQLEFDVGTFRSGGARTSGEAVDGNRILFTSRIRNVLPGVPYIVLFRNDEEDTRAVRALPERVFVKEIVLMTRQKSREPSPPYFGPIDCEEC